LLYPDLEESERARRFGVSGGTPFYHQSSVGSDLENAIRDGFLRPAAPLLEEPQNLLRRELQPPLRHNPIMYEIGNGTHDLPTLEAKVGVGKGGLGPYLQTLRDDMDLLRMEDPVCGKKRQARYIFSDPLFAFYYRFVFDSRSRLELGRFEAVLGDIRVGLDAHLGHVAERVARDALVMLNGKERRGSGQSSTR
jgi:hypothetical protein